VLALAAALGTVWLLELQDGSVRNPRDLQALLQVAPLAIVPHMETLAEIASRRRLRRFTLAGAAGALAVALILTHVFYRPLDVLWDVALRRL
jgi:hypothetical protein